MGSSKMLLNPKVLLCICLTFIPFNNGQFRVPLPRSDTFGDGMNKPQLQSQPRDPLAPRYLHLESDDPARIFLEMRNVMEKVKNDPRTLRGGTYYPRDGSRPISIYPFVREEMGHLDLGPRFGRRQPTEGEKKMNAWIESRFSTPTNEEEIEYFKKLGSFPGTHYVLPKHCVVNATFCKNGFAPVGFIMDPDVIHSCPLGPLDLTNKIPKFVLSHFTDDTCARKEIKVCYYCQVEENQYEMAQFCKLNLNPEPSLCHQDQRFPIDDEEIEHLVPVGTEKRYIKQRLPGDREILPTSYRGVRSSNRKEWQDRVFGEDYMKIPGSNTVNVIEVLGTCSQCT